MVEYLEEIKGYKKLSWFYKTKLIFVLKEYLDSFTVDELKNSDIISVKRNKKDKLFEVTVLKYNKTDIVYLKYV